MSLPHLPPTSGSSQAPAHGPLFQILSLHSAARKLNSIESSAGKGARLRGSLARASKGDGPSSAESPRERMARARSGSDVAVRVAALAQLQEDSEPPASPDS